MDRKPKKKRKKVRKVAPGEDNPGVESLDGCKLSLYNINHFQK